MLLDEADYESRARTRHQAGSTESFSSLDLGILSFLPSAFRAADTTLGVCESEWHEGIPILNAYCRNALCRVGRSSQGSNRHRRASHSGVIAIGGIAVGVVAIGGLAIGGIAVGGLSLAILALGGGAFGWWALGGAALGRYALGGFAFGDYAYAGSGVAYGYHEASGRQKEKLFG